MEDELMGYLFEKDNLEDEQKKAARKEDLDAESLKDNLEFKYRDKNGRMLLHRAAFELKNKTIK
jgi:hypothetical protein